MGRIERKEKGAEMRKAMCAGWVALALGLAGPAEAGKAAEARIEADCAAWDGPALSIQVGMDERSDLRASVWRSWGEMPKGEFALDAGGNMPYGAARVCAKGDAGNCRRVQGASARVWRDSAGIVRGVIRLEGKSYPFEGRMIPRRSDPRFCG